MIDRLVSSDLEDTEVCPRQERRATVRYRLPLNKVNHSALANSFRSFEGLVLALSATGLGVILHDQIEAGIKVFIQLKGKSGQGADIPELVAKVKCAAAHEEHGWLMWCAFKKPLSDEQMQALR
jgi:hypothetical protein